MKNSYDAYCKIQNRLECRLLNAELFKHKHDISSLPLRLNQNFAKVHDLYQSTINEFQIEYCKSGRLENRIIFPIYHFSGFIIAYCGILESEHKDIIFEASGVKSSEIIFNIDRQRLNVERLIIVQDFISLFKYHQKGMKNIVSIITDSLTELQIAILSEFFNKFTIFKNRPLNLNGLESKKEVSIVLLS